MVSYLELVLASLSGWGWVEEIDGENLFRQHHVSICISESIIEAYMPISTISSISSRMQSRVYKKKLHFRDRHL